MSCWKETVVPGENWESSVGGLEICENVQEIAQKAAAELIKRSESALVEARRCHVALSGGSTPKFLYESLVAISRRDPKVQKALENVNWFFSDERFVAPTDSQSNFFLAFNSLFSEIKLEDKFVFRVPTEDLSPEQAAREYEQTIRSLVPHDENKIPRFDLVFLGMGDDGHTASLFPGTDLVSNLIAKREPSLVSAVWVEKVKMHRITFTPTLINGAACVTVMAAGVGKAETLQHVLFGPRNPRLYPIQLVRPNGGLLRWLVDKDAARALN